MKSTIPFVGLDVHIGNDLSQLEKLATEKREIENIRIHFARVKLVCQQALQELRV
jgi:hypothetical protein